MFREAIVKKVDEYYSGKLAEFGTTPKGVDWNSGDSQRRRFRQLMRAVEETAAESVLDYGCGYGAFADYAYDSKPGMRYSGYDVSPAMVDAARTLHPDLTFSSERTAICAADAVVASGIFSVRMDVSIADWESYIDATIDDMWSLGRKAIAFNMLTAYSDADRMRADLYYADPIRYFARCRRLSRWVALLHDYGLYEFTLVVRADD